MEAVMLRIITVGLAISAWLSAASAQVGQFPQVPAPSPPMVQLAPLPVPPPNVGAPSNLVTVPGLPPVNVPAGPPHRNSFSDRVERCIQAGTAAGIGPNDIGAFTRQCAN